MPLKQYAVDFRRSLFRVDPMMPILRATAGVGDVFCLEPRGRRGSPCVGRGWIHRAGGGRINCDRRTDQHEIPSPARRSASGTG